jgi:Mg/Co/Ni transporter MgtE
MDDMSDEPYTRVTLAQVYSLLQETAKKFDSLADVPSKVDDHEVRIRAIEKYLWIWIGAAAVLGAGAGQVIQRLFGVS